MKKKCPNTNCTSPFSFKKDGHFKRKEDGKIIQRYRCKTCSARFSSATFSLARWQKKRKVNTPLLELLSSGVSLRRSAKLLKLSRSTVEKKLPYLGKLCALKNERALKKQSVSKLQVDDLITLEHSKLKPLSVSVAVNSENRHILAVEVSRIAAFGKLAKISVKKYGKRKSKHREAFENLMAKIAPVIKKNALIESDGHQEYARAFKKFLPGRTHQIHASEPACVVGQGELKKVQFDPLFAVNHTLAMLRANINRLIRRSWCTTKVPERLKDHLEIFIYYFNTFLIS